MRPGRRQLLLGLASLFAVACSPRELDRYFDSGQYVQVAGAFEADPELQSDERALFEAGVAYAVPGSDVHDPELARTLLTRLLDLYPDTRYRGEASRVLSFVRREERLAARLAQVSNTLEELKAVDLGPGANDATPGSGEFNRLFEEGRYARAVALFEADSSLHSAQHALFRAAVAYSLPDGGTHDPRRARELFGRLLELYPGTAYRDEATWFTDLLALEEELRRQIGRLEGEIEELKAIDLGMSADSTH